MDIFKQNRYLFAIIILLVILNLTTLIMLWLGRSEYRQPRLEQRDPIEEENRISQMLKDELGFDKQQIDKYLQLRKQHRDKVHLLNGEIRQIKKQMFDEALVDIPKTELSDSLLTISQTKQAEIERLTFQHFLELKKLCKPEQQDKLKLLIHELFRGRPAGDDQKEPQPPPNDNRRPPPPPKNN